MSSLPALNNECSQLIRPLEVAQNEPPLKLRICHGMREFPVTLRIADNENGARISMRHLAEVVLYETGIIPREQRYCFHGVTWKNPDLGPWSPGLRDLGLKNGDKVQLVAFHHAVPDWESVVALEALEKRFSKLASEIDDIFHRVHGSTRDELATFHVDVWCMSVDRFFTLASEIHDIFHRLYVTTRGELAIFQVDVWCKCVSRFSTLASEIHDIFHRVHGVSWQYFRLMCGVCVWIVSLHWLQRSMISSIDYTRLDGNISGLCVVYVFGPFFYTAF
ncbi:hypothetical protein RRG08_037931 [Elysia crispata]|uniref:Ubiquitin-like domain-containing protein n=1 Tax=Elysia crispata TaxID=231223 RepID=A0AAE0Z567_9GAST|nr:hypothetical protein RRG08_037931 [Elysia crispata]